MNKLQIAVAAGLLTLIPAVAMSAGNAAEGKNKSAVCHACHGPTGQSVQPIYPNLGGQYQDYLAKTLREYRNGTRQNAIMAGFAANLSDDDIDDISAWYASQQGLTEIKDK
ncbi:MAG: c-type cytochrome [Gammaproteobacteria bacterium]|nr:c-type cytochrome [Gammaproteobacteria bacterium]